MGLGKTFGGSEKMKQLGAKVNLVVCQKSKVQDWIDHFKEYYPEYTVWNLTHKFQYDTFVDKNFNQQYYPCIGIINYDLLFRRGELLRVNRDFTLMLDESSLIQNEQAKRSKFVLKMKPKNVILLSGTPTGGRYEKLWSQMRLLGWNISKKMYYNHYINYHFDDSNGFPLMIIDGYKNVERLKRKMREYGCNFLKTNEVFDLPDQIHQTIGVTTTTKYRTFRKNCIVNFDNIELVGDTTLTKMLYERQLCGQYNDDKIAAFKDLVESTNDRLIVFYNFNAELEALQHICEVQNRDLSMVNGQVKDLYAYENKNDSVTFIQYQAGAMGLNLQKANKIVYFTPPLSSELFEQSKKRTHRIGQTNTCFYYYLTCKNSIEEKIYKTLTMRQDFTEKLFGKKE